MMQNKISSCGNNKTFHGTDNYAQLADLNFNLISHRFISIAICYKEVLSPAFIETLAANGFYCAIEGGHISLRCASCKVHVTEEEFSSYLDRSYDFALEKILGMPEKAYCKNGALGSQNSTIWNALNYRFEANRLYSLLQKNDWQYVNPFSLASIGFYYTGDGDNVRCAFCNVEVRGWEAGDTAEGEHRRWNPNCPFLCNEQSVPNIKIGKENTDLKHDSLVAIIPTGAQSYPVAQPTGQPPAPVMDNQGAQLPAAALPEGEAAVHQGEVSAPQGEAAPQQDLQGNA